VGRRHGRGVQDDRSTAFAGVDELARVDVSHTQGYGTAREGAGRE
jgi:hypothetical protein